MPHTPNEKQRAYEQAGGTLSTSAPTPGPWLYLPPLGPGNHSVMSAKVNSNGNFYVATVHTSETDARLMAAAPLLLEACTLALKILPTLAPETVLPTLEAKLQAAIAAAEKGA